MNKNKNTDLSRRRFLTRSSVVAVGVAAMGSGLFTARTWAASALGEDASATLLRMARDIYPHDKLEDEYYIRVLEQLPKLAQEDQALKSILVEGVADLDRRALKQFGRPYMEISHESERVQILRAIEDSDFFQRIRGDLMMGIYNNPDLWPHFGFGGSAWQQGGYLHRGYNAIDWL